MRTISRLAAMAVLVLLLVVALAAPAAAADLVIQDTSPAAAPAAILLAPFVLGLAASVLARARAGPERPSWTAYKPDRYITDLAFRRLDPRPLSATDYMTPNNRRPSVATAYG